MSLASDDIRYASLVRLGGDDAVRDALEHVFWQFQRFDNKRDNVRSPKVALAMLVHHKPIPLLESTEQIVKRLPIQYGVGGRAEFHDRQEGSIGGGQVVQLVESPGEPLVHAVPQGAYHFLAVALREGLAQQVAAVDDVVVQPRLCVLEVDYVLA